MGAHCLRVADRGAEIKRAEERLDRVQGEPGPGLRLRVLDTLDSCESSALALGMQLDDGATAPKVLLR